MIRELDVYAVVDEYIGYKGYEEGGIDKRTEGDGREKEGKGGSTLRAMPLLYERWLSRHFPNSELGAYSLAFASLLTLAHLQCLLFWTPK